MNKSKIKEGSTKANQNSQTFFMSIGIFGLVLIAFISVSIKVDFTFLDYIVTTGGGLIASGLFYFYYHNF